MTAPRVLAVVSEPAEAKPGATVAFRALVAGPDGTLPSPDLAWAFCTAPKPLTTDAVVSAACLESGSLVPLGRGPSVTATLPANACALFGPDPPPGGARPRDPDPTGGYYQPVRVDGPGTDTTFALARIACDLAGASAAAASAFADAYVTNANPVLLPLVATIGGAAIDLSVVPAGARVDLRASWPAESAETYAVFDATGGTVLTKREAMTVAWYASAGLLEHESTGRAEDDPATTVTNAWTAPSTAGPVYLWTVLRDSRGGAAFATDAIGVNPPSR